MLTMERAENLTKYLTADPNKAQELLAKSPEEAVITINAAGYDFTVEELNEYCQAFKAAVMQDELNAEDLDSVAGGIVLTTGMVIGLIGCFAGGMAVGVACGAKW